MSIERPRDVPKAPGVYEFLDETGRVLYVGKAKNLAARLASYFRGDLHPRTLRMRQAASAVRYTLCASEQEALVLEREWINAKQPPFNIRLRAGSGYSGVALTRGETPRLVLWRGRRPERAETFGPYPGVPGRELLDALSLVFGVRTCNDAEYSASQRRGRPCLLGETGRCLAPCVGQVDPATHNEAARRCSAYLRRPDPSVEETMRDEMLRLAAEQNFEGAVILREKLKALEVMGRRQRIVTGEDWAAVAVVVRRNEERLVAVEVNVNDGVVASLQVHHAENDPETSDQEALETVLHSLGAAASTLTETGAAGTTRARRRREKDLLLFAATQAEHALQAPAETRRWSDPAARLEAAQELRRALDLPGQVRRIECIDISHTQGVEAVGSLVVFEDGEERQSEWRHVALGTTGGDDYAAIAATVHRRLSGNRMGLPPEPDLLLIDGGPGQVTAALQAMRDLGIEPGNLGGEGPYLVGIAKRFEELWPAEAQRPVLLDAADPALLLVTRIRDAAHNNGNTAHRRRRERAALRTGLETVTGLGPRRQAALMSRFGTLDALAAAPAAEIAAVRGIGPSLAGRIHAALHPGQ